MSQVLEKEKLQPSADLRVGGHGQRHEEIHQAYAAVLEKSSLSTNTRRAYGLRVAGYLEWLSNEYYGNGASFDPLTEPLARDAAVRQYQVHLIDTAKRSPATVDATVDALAHFYRVRGMGPLAVTRESRARVTAHVVADAVQQRIVDALDRRGSRDRAMGLVLLGAGLRVSELTRLNTEDVVLSEGSARIAVGTSTGDRRVVPVGETTRTAMEAWLTERSRWSIADGERAFFVSRAGRRLSRQAVDQFVRAWGIEADAPGLTARQLRDKFVANLLRASVDPERVNYLVGSGRANCVQRAIARSPQDSGRAAKEDSAVTAEAGIIVTAETFDVAHTAAENRDLLGFDETSPLIIGNLPLELDSFIGRDEELAESRRILRRARLLTLVGPAGSGKSRLALRLAGGSRRLFPGGVFRLDLSSLDSVEQFIGALSEALGIDQCQRGTFSDASLDRLSGRRRLLLLDNYDHLIETAAQIAESLLQRCPSLRILATGREALRVTGEVNYKVGPLSLPHPGHIRDSPSLLASDSVRLFVERARATNPGLKFDDDDVRSVAGICEKLDALPLAIEFAARSVSSLPVSEIRARIDEGSDLPALAPRSAAPRHRSLRASIQWSYALLDPAEKAVFRRLSVFKTCFSREGAAAACAEGDVCPGDVARILTALIAKSLVESTGSGADLRLRQLEPVRLFGRSELDASGELPATFQRLVGWVTELVQPLAKTAFVTAGLARIWHQECGAIYDVYEWSREVGDDRQALFATALAHCWSERGRTADAQDLLVDALTDMNSPARHRLVALGQSARLAAYQADYEQARRLATEARDLEDGAGSSAILVLDVLRLICQRMGDLTTAREYAAQGVEAALAHTDAAHAATLAHKLAWITLLSGDADRAAVILEEVLPVYRAHIDGPPLAAYLHTCGAVALAQGDLDRAEGFFKDSIEPGRLSPRQVAEAIEGLAIAAAERAELARAVRLGIVAAALRPPNSPCVDPFWHPRFLEADTKARGRLGSAELELAAKHVERLTFDGIIDYAIHDVLPLAENDEAARFPLSTREWEVAALMASGLTNRRIAGRLKVTERTIESHLDHVRVKLDLHSRAQVAIWVRDRQISHGSAQPTGLDLGRSA